MVGSSKSDQHSGDNSVNIQVGRDVILNARSASEMREIAIDVYRANALELRGIAQEIAMARAERVTEDFLKKLTQENPHAIANLSDPDIQHVTFGAQTEFARSGEEDLGQVLVDLLSDRALETSRSLRNLALNEAISCVGKLTEAQRRAIALVFILKYSRWNGTEESVESYFREHVSRQILPLSLDLPDSPMDYQHIEYVGAGSVSQSFVSLANCLRSGVEYLFTNGFRREEIPEDVCSSGRLEDLVMPALRDPDALQLRCRTPQEMQKFAEFHEVPELENALINLMNQGLMSEQMVLEEAVKFDPKIDALAAKWDSTQLPSLTLTTVGLAIGHAYWRRITGATEPLSIWL